MNTIGWLFIVVAALLIRGVANGRGFAAFTDLGDAFKAIIEDDTGALSEVWSRTGDSNTPTATAGAAATVDPDLSGNITGGTTGGASLLAEMKRLGSKAKGYKWTATGPDYYDCSGLVWRAGKNIGLWGSPRFTSGSWPSFASKHGWKLLSGPNATPMAGDIFVGTVTLE